MYTYMRSYTTDEIAHLTGIPSNKVMEVCNLLSMEGYLIFDKETNKYRLTKDRDFLKNVKKLWKQCKDDHAFEQMSGKIEDIIEFGKPLALSEKGPGAVVKDIGVPGLNIIFGKMGTGSETEEAKSEVGSKKVPGLPRGHCLLIKGAPGTGKTTLGLQIAIYLKKYRARFLTFEEDVNQLMDDLHGYIQDENKNNNPDGGWKKSDIKEVTRSLIKIRTPQAWENPDVVMEELISIFDRELPHLIVIDSISRFRDFGGDEKARQILRRLIRNLKCRRITSIFTAEERGEENPFEDYEVDGIINLQWSGDLLTLTVKKLRGLIAYKGPHSAALMGVKDLKEPKHELISEKKVKKGGFYLTAGFNVFPDISVFKDISGEVNKKEGESINIDDYRDKEEEPVKTGTPGLDELLLLPGEGKTGFRKGETILLVGSSGAGKTLLALNYMLDGFGRKNQTEKKEEKLVWINLEGGIGTLRFATGGFEDSYKGDLNHMIDDMEHKETEWRFSFVDYPPLNLDLNKIVYTLEAIRRGYGRIDRLVIDSITELERAKGGGQPAVKVFLAGLIEFLRKRKITTIFVCRADAFFRSIDKIEEQVSSLVDLIICIRNFDIHNEIHRGVYIQKARGRSHNSRVIRMIIDPERGIDIEDSGWDLENLLAGDTSNIESPRVFFKLFYENPAEEFINNKIIEDFDKIRYPGDDPKFTLVKKPSIYTEFWSFKGQFSAGHANTRVLSIPDYVISAFRDNDRLAELDKYVKSELLQNIENELALVRRYPKRRDETRTFPYIILEREIGLHDRIIDSIPCYHDYGVMVLKEPILIRNSISQHLKKFIKLLKSQTKNIGSKDDSVWVKKGCKWEKLLQMIKNINEKGDNGIDISQDQEIVSFAFPPLDKKSEFVAFFMELLWSHGGDIFKSNVKYRAEREEDEDSFKNYIKRSVFLEFIHNLPGEKEEIIETLSAEKKPDKEKDILILKEFEGRFFTYRLELKGIDIKEFKLWIKERLEKIEEPEEIKKESVLKNHSVLLLNDNLFKETIKLMLRLVHRGGVTNPIEGEFRHRAILSRNWYSRIAYLKLEKCKNCLWSYKNKCKHRTGLNKEECMKNYLLKKEEYKLLPLPLARVEFSGKDRNDQIKTCYLYRSVTCLTCWSLVMLKNALSPEIGGNFIESMNSPDYYEERLRNRFGMPVTQMEMKKEKFRDFDPDSYAILSRIWENGVKNDDTLDENKNSTEYTYVYRDFIDSLEESESPVLFFEKHKDHFDRRIFFAKVRQSRTAFYQLEEALHFQLKQLFIEDPYAREERIHKDLDIYNETKAACKEDQYDTDPDSNKPIIKESDRWEKCLNKITHEFRMHVIFELLSYFYHEHLTGAEAREEKAKVPTGEG
jgi:KaiC/GvpD/RAD55 family RecA-like ATPase